MNTRENAIEDKHVGQCIGKMHRVTNMFDSSLIPDW